MFAGDYSDVNIENVYKWYSGTSLKQTSSKADTSLRRTDNVGPAGRFLKKTLIGKPL